MNKRSISHWRGGLRVFAPSCFCALLILATVPFSAPARAQARRLGAGTFVVAVDGNRAECREAPADEALANRDTSALHEIRRSAARKTGPGLTIVLRATDQLEQYPQAKAAFARAADTWERTIARTPITIVVDVDYGPTYFGSAFPANVLGVTDPQLLLSAKEYGFVRSQLVADASSDEEKAFYATLPAEAVPTDLGATRDLYAPTASLRAVHFLPAEQKPGAEHDRGLGNPPALAISSAFAYDFDPSDGIDADKRDFETVVLHELGHVLGFTSVVGARETNASFPAAVSLLDLFRFRPGVTSSSFATAKRILSSGGEQVFFGGGDTLALSTGRQDATGGDARQASHWKDEAFTGVFIGLMHPSLKPGVHETLTASDLLAFDRLGYSLAEPPGVIASLSAALDGDVLTFSGTLDGAPTDVASAEVTMLDDEYQPVHTINRFPVSIGATPDFALAVRGFDRYRSALAARLTLFDAAGTRVGQALADFGAGDPGGPSIKRATLTKRALTVAGSGFTAATTVEIDGAALSGVTIRVTKNGTRLSVKATPEELGLAQGYNRVRVVENGLGSNLTTVLFEQTRER